MHTATLTEKFQIYIPKAFQDDLGLKAGQQFIFVAKGDTIVMIPPYHQCSTWHVHTCGG